MNDKPNKVKANGKALIPFLTFILIYLGSGIILQSKGVEMAFYQFPAPVAVFCGVIVAFIMFKGTINEKFMTFIHGCGNEDIIIMCTIYLLAGAFAGVSKAMGGVDSTVNLGLTFIPAQYITAGLFVISAFIAIATGTSCGALAAVAPIAVGLAAKAGLSLPLTMAAVVGGSMFGDNLSVISDTTIAATRTQGCQMRDKFKLNLFIALPPAIITIILLIIFGHPTSAVQMQSYDYNIIKVLPYLFVLILSIAGLNVFAVLTGGIFVSGIIGFAYGQLTLLSFAQQTFSGFTSMTDIFLVSMITGGLAHMVTKEGGLQYILDRIQKMIKGKKSAEIGIAALVSLTDAAIANNTVSIIINGPIAKEISEEYKVDPRRSASLLDIFACVMQGMIPYGAQMLMVGSFTKGVVSPMQVMPLLWYQQLLVVSAIASMYIPFADKLIKKNPWNWEKGQAV
ncbi:Na+/H+ antiporter NhaC family protein [Clostridium ganghwense]|uniref:Na+/H+ antiporter NhaC family protein n=1 Tax=Clostridium ganghwense TaxID=312089 RepID=A0ABT4CUF6_9CLOT|nr:Na+/H+ antiporter NhaC family protein [Clostridium ganghwense]MCY6372715.1 Na+/H+ antiporter NhaC family protein [Clostridium ganghwense]